MDDNFGQVAVDLSRILQILRANLPSVRIQCMAESGGPLALLLAAWGNGEWVEKPVAVLQPGQTTTVKVAHILQGTDNKIGETLLFRRAAADTTAYKLTNVDDDTAIMYTITPAISPWWQGKSTKWGPNNPYLLLPGKYVYDFIEANCQDVLFYSTVS